MAEDPFDKRASRGSLWLRELQRWDPSLELAAWAGLSLAPPTLQVGLENRSGRMIRVESWILACKGRIEADVEPGGSWSLTSLPVLSPLG